MSALLLLLLLAASSWRVDARAMLGFVPGMYTPFKFSPSGV